MTEGFQQDIQSMYTLAERSKNLADLVPALCDVLRRNGDSLADVTYAYRLTATDTGYSCAFALQRGVFMELDTAGRVDVTVAGTDAHLLAVFQRKLNPMTAMLLGKIKVNGSKTALMKLATFL